jgi:hypothetical protein
LSAEKIYWRFVGGLEGTAAIGNLPSQIMRCMQTLQSLYSTRLSAKVVDSRRGDAVQLVGTLAI